MTDPTQPSPSTGAASHPESDSAQNARHHVRPSRRGVEARLPLAVRKELLLTRAALERYDYMHARNDLHRATRRTFSLGGLGALLPSLIRPLARPNSLMRTLGIAREYPLVGTVLSLAYAGLRRTVIGRATRKLGKLGLVAGAAWWGYQKWRESHGDGGQHADAPAAASGADADDIIPGSTS
ncbi:MULTISPECIES: DUF3318 domain-containing protein [Ralstonia]|uniref:Protein of uncharacterized function (DUF3318) n=1 Tax=Ralstonia mannitolilytica TaxID=105219 RepID=A0AAJ4ZMK6_9RALS|nr:MULTISPECIES: DUF3318 domain-containing protein [Ralstonia]AJW44732.1 hypothetical protein TK49_08440 [Ralstonia mannitolilytica]MBU9578609.1 DUF3318 domain-containing protein [Ralstonia mannitolilytica]PLT17099.1 DUF3318 domain-containing protein [Ralstonia mannitolilytica]CAG2135429.1 hypothetical protein LMG6866_01263 [Ralstonia mannitolilytica]CAJ0731412.1 hypothetical protein R77592_02659 [Ralstonia mannitolilytica]